LEVWTRQSDLADLLASAAVTEKSVPLLLSLAARYERQGKIPMDLLTKCQMVRPEDFWANLSLGLALKAKKNPAESLRYFQSAVAIRPTSGAAYGWLALALSDLHRLDEAIDALNVAVKVDPESSANLNNLSTFLFLRRRHAEAIPWLRITIRHRPADGRLYLYLGYSLRAVGQGEEGLKHLQHGIELDPIFFVNWQYRISLLSQGCAAEDLRKLWRSALAADPPKHDAWDGYAELSLFVGREDEYQWARREILKRFAKTSDPHVAERTGRACLFLPGTDDELQQAAVLIGKALAADRSKLEPWVPPFFGFAEGLLAFRQGRFKESAAILKGDAGRILGPAPGLVLAMDQFHLGQKDEAQKTMEKAIQAFDWQQAKADSREPWMYHILRREAEGLIRPISPR
jgi:serine/threonine-protein kinase